jgi:uncharacterized membrane protein
MAFWIFMFVVALLIPAAMIVMGTIFAKRPPKNINPTFGYRSTRSMKNKTTWDFAHRYFGKSWKTTGIVLLFSAPLMLFVLGKSVQTVSYFGGIIVIAQCVVMFVPIHFSERALKREFTDSGKRRKL